MGRALCRPQRVATSPATAIATAATSACSDSDRSVPLDYELFHPAFRGDNHKPSPTDLAGADVRQRVGQSSSRCASSTSIRACRRATIDDTNDPNPDPARAFDINEKSLAGYAQANFAVRRRRRSTVDGHARRSRGAAPRTTSSEPRRVPGHAPDADRVQEQIYRLAAQREPEHPLHADQVQLRLAATQDPHAADLPAAQSVAQSSTRRRLRPAPADCVRTGGGGNPFLKPLKSNNYDASLEYYFSRTGFASLAVFHRDMHGLHRQPDLPAIPTPDPDNRTAAGDHRPGQHAEGPRSRASKPRSAPSSTSDWCRHGRARSAPKPTSPTSMPKIDLTVVRARIVECAFPTCRSGRITSSRMYEAHGLSVRLSYNQRSSYPEGAIADDAGNGNGFTLPGARQPGAAARPVDELHVQRQVHGLLRLDEHPQQAVQVGHPLRQLYRRATPTSVENLPDGRALRGIDPVGRHSLPFRRRRAPARGAAAGRSSAASAARGRAGSGSATAASATATAAATGRTRRIRLRATMRQQGVGRSSGRPFSIRARRLRWASGSAQSAACRPSRTSARYRASACPRPCGSRGRGPRMEADERAARRPEDALVAGAAEAARLRSLKLWRIGFVGRRACTARAARRSRHSPSRRATGAGRRFQPKKPPEKNSSYPAARTDHGRRFDQLLLPRLVVAGSARSGAPVTDRPSGARRWPQMRLRW